MADVVAPAADAAAAPEKADFEKVADASAVDVTATLVEPAPDAPKKWFSGFTEYWTSIFAAGPPPTIVATAETYKKAGALAPACAAIDNFFAVSDRGSTFATEFRGGMSELV